MRRDGRRRADDPRVDGPSAGRRPTTEPWERQAGEVLAAVLRGDAAARARASGPSCSARSTSSRCLYVALGRGGNPQRIVASRSLQYVLRRLLGYLPRLGLLTETCRLLETAQRMEAEHPVGPGAITEFDRVFEIGCKAITQCLVVSSADWQAGKKASGRRQAATSVAFFPPADDQLIDCLEQVIEVLLRCWLRHSHGVRLSVLETVGDPQRWRRLKQFIERYGGDLFTQRFMNLGNLRGILHQGVREYLETLAEEPDPDEQFRLLGELDGAIPLDEAAHWLAVAIEAVVENYGEYIDYNSITTQSDRGDMLYTLLDFLRLRAELRPAGLEPAAGGAGPRGPGALRPRRGRRDLAPRRGRADRAHGRRTSETFRPAVQEVRDAAAEHRRTPRRAVRPAVGDRSALCADASGHRRDSRAAGRRQRCGNWRSRSPASPRSRRAPASSCPVGWRPWNKRWSKSSGRRPRRRKRRSIRTSAFPRSGSRGPRSSGRFSRCSARERSGRNVVPQNSNATLHRLAGGLARRVFAAKSHTADKPAG